MATRAPWDDVTIIDNFSKFLARVETRTAKYHLQQFFPRLGHSLLRRPTSRA